MKKNIVELSADLSDVQRGLDACYDDYAELEWYGNEDLYDPTPKLQLLQKEQSILAAISEEKAANEAALAYEREECRLCGIRVRM